RVHARRIPLAPNVDLKVLARGTPGFSGADLANLVNEAALLAARQNKKLVEMVDFENAKDKVLMGVERRSMIISDAEKRTIAYHEAGHTLVADFLPGDRKSTRLNSSHVSISYAVFCLKKKKKKKKSKYMKIKI